MKSSSVGIGRSEQRDKIDTIEIRTRILLLTGAVQLKSIKMSRDKIELRGSDQHMVFTVQLKSTNCLRSSVSSPESKVKTELMKVPKPIETVRQGYLEGNVWSDY